MNKYFPWLTLLFLFRVIIVGANMADAVCFFVCFLFMVGTKALEMWDVKKADKPLHDRLNKLENDLKITNEAVATVKSINNITGMRNGGR